MKEVSIKRFAKLAIFSAALIWGSSFVVVKDVVGVLPPNYLMAIRFTGATAVLSAIFYKNLRGITRKMLWQGAIIGFFLFCAYCSQTLGIMDTTPGKNAFLTAVYCVLVPFLFWAVSGMRPDRYNLLAAVVCLAGIGFISLKGGFSMSAGDLLTLLGGFFYAAHMVAVSKFMKGQDPVTMTILQFAAAAVLFWIATLVFEGLPSAIPPTAIGGILYLCLFATAAALLLQNFGQKHTPPAAAAIFLSLEAVLGVVFSVLLRREQLTLKTTLGFALIFIAVIISETKLSFLKKKEED